ncbi:MAG: hypothetical protein IPG25_09540 [Proteobacteria bacterium]|nr:hypothetical protein [Pseudomonadota bacterium]
MSKPVDDCDQREGNNETRKDGGDGARIQLLPASADDIGSMPSSSVTGADSQ